MKYRVYNILIISLLCFINLNANADIISNNYDASNGLISNTVRCFYEDAKGRLWIGTEGGISIYNGYSYRPITVADGLAGNVIWDIVADENGGKWIACFGNGLTYLKNGKTTIYNKKDGLDNLKIRTLLFHDKTLFIGTINGLYFLNNGKIHTIHPSKLGHQLPFEVMQIFTHRQKIYVVTRSTGVFQIQKTSENDYYLKKIADSHNFYRIITLNNGKHLVCTKNGVFLQNELSSDKKEKITDKIIWSVAKQKQSNNIFMASWNLTRAGGGLFALQDKQLINQNQKFKIHSSKVWVCKFLHNGLLAIGTLDNGFYLVNLHFSSFKQYDLLRIQGQFTWQQNTYFYNKNQIIDSNGKLIFELDNEIIASKYTQQDTKPNKILEFHLNIDKQSIYTIKPKKNQLFISTSCGLLKLDADFNIEHIYPLKINLFCIWDATLFYESPDQQLIIYKDFLQKGLSQPIANTSQEIQPTHIIHYQKLSDKLILWTKENSLYFIHKDNYPITHHPLPGNSRIKCVNTWKKRYIAITPNNTIYKGVIREKKTSKITIQSPIQFNNILSASTNGDNFILQTDQGLIVYLVGTIRLFNRFNFLKHKKITTAFIKGMDLIICTEKKVFSFKLHELLGYYLYPPNLIVTPLKEKEIPASQEGMVIHVEKVATQFPSNYGYYFSVNKGDTIPIIGEKIYLMNLSSGDYTIQLLVYNNFNATWHNSDTLFFNKNLPIWMQSIFWIIIILILITLFLISNLRRKLRIKKKEIQKQEIEQRISSLKLEAIRAKMNPHFMFNALNSIQNFVIDEDVDNALLYLSEFAKLMRQTLDFSSLEKISIEDELDFLNRYIRIERMRFSCDIHIEKDIDQAVYHTEIPPMILQPLLENAFIHGIDKNTQSTQIISLKMQVIAPKTLFIQIINSKEKDKTQHVNHHSFALNAIKERLQLNHPNNSLNIYNNPQLFKVEIRFVLND